MQKSDAAPVGLAGKITRFSVNLLVSGLLIVAALALGRQGLLLWSSVQSPPASTDVIGRSDIGSAEATHKIEFAGGRKMIREPFTGESAAAFERLRQLASAINSTEPWSREPAAWERRLLKSIEHQSPVATDTRQGIDYYEQAGPFLMSAAVARSDGTRGSRIVSWGLATPATTAVSNDSDARSWMLFVMAKPANLANQTLAALTPPKAEIVISLETPDGAMSVVFQGAGDIDVWRERFRMQLEKAGARQDSQQTADSIHQCYVREGQRIDLFFSQQDERTMIHMNVAITTPTSLSN